MNSGGAGPIIDVTVMTDNVVLIYVSDEALGTRRNCDIAGVYVKHTAAGVALTQQQFTGGCRLAHCTLDGLEHFTGRNVREIGHLPHTSLKSKAFSAKYICAAWVVLRGILQQRTKGAKAGED